MHHHPEDIICGCLNVTAAEVQQVAEAPHVRSVRDVSRHTGAGTGCTACHCAIRDLLGGCSRQVDQPLAVAVE